MEKLVTMSQVSRWRCRPWRWGLACDHDQNR
eukprot:SAG25_NODE_7126_length_503_cov_0.891089_1_plen_30_part_01